MEETSWKTELHQWQKRLNELPDNMDEVYDFLWEIKDFLFKEMRNRQRCLHPDLFPKIE